MTRRRQEGETRSEGKKARELSDLPAFLPSYLLFFLLCFVYLWLVGRAAPDLLLFRHDPARRPPVRHRMDLPQGLPRPAGRTGRLCLRVSLPGLLLLMAGGRDHRSGGIQPERALPTASGDGRVGTRLRSGPSPGDRALSDLQPVQAPVDCLPGRSHWDWPCPSSSRGCPCVSLSVRAVLCGLMATVGFWLGGAGTLLVFALMTVDLRGSLTQGWTTVVLALPAERRDRLGPGGIRVPDPGPPGLRLPHALCTVSDGRPGSLPEGPDVPPVRLRASGRVAGARSARDCSAGEDGHPTSLRRRSAR